MKMDKIEFVWDRISELKQRVRDLKEQSANEQEIRTALDELAEFALKNDFIYNAVRAFEELGDKRGLKRAADKGLQIEYGIDTFIAYRLLNDQEGIKRFIEQKAASRDTCCYLEYSVSLSGLDKKAGEGFQRFLQEKGYEKAAWFPLSETANAAQNLVQNYDYGVGIAKGGLFSSYVFSVFGLPTLIAESHKRGRGATFKWIDNPDDIQDKKVLVFDKDAVSGRTLRRTIREIQACSPKRADLYVNHSVSHHLMSIRSIPESIPREFSNVYYPNNIDYNNFWQAYQKLEQEFGGKHENK